MSNFRTTADLKALVLEKCGELNDGSSYYEQSALNYLNSAYQGLLAGGSEFGVDVAEDWAWAKAKRPLVLTLLPAVDIEVTLSAGSSSGTLSTLPVDNFGDPLSLSGYFLRVDTHPTFYRIATHSAGSTSFTLDQRWLSANDTYSARAIPLEYELADNTVVVAPGNDAVDFKLANSSNMVATLVHGSYQASDFIAHVAARMTLMSGTTFTGSFDTLTRLFTLSAPTAFQLLFASGANSVRSASRELGFDLLDTAASTEQQASYALNSIQRLCGPMITYVEPDIGAVSTSNRDAGKIFGLNFDTLKQDYPLSRMAQGLPDRFAEVSLASNGICTVRFNRYPAVMTRVEVDYIALERDLQSNSLSTPLLPRAFREYLVFAACYFVSVDKSDNRAVEFLGQAKNKLAALVNHNRKGSRGTSKDFGRMIPRKSAGGRSWL